MQFARNKNQGTKGLIDKINFSLTKAINLVFFGLGAIFLLVSIIFVSSILAFIGLGLIFWGVLFSYVPPVGYIKKEFLTATLIAQVSTLNQLIDQLGYTGKPIYLPQNYFKNHKTTKIYLPKQNRAILLSNQKSTPENFYYDNSQGILVTPPGIHLVEIFEETLGTNISELDLSYVLQNLESILVDDLEIAEKLKITTEHEKIYVQLTNSIFSELHTSSSLPASKIGCPLCSAIACVLTEVSQKPTIIDEIQSLDGKTVKVIYKLQEQIKAEPPAEYLVESMSQASHPIKLFSQLFVFMLTTSGSLILASVAWLTYYDMVYWGKNLETILFDSRSGEVISLGMGLNLSNYLLIGGILLLSGLLVYISNKRIKFR